MYSKITCLLIFYSAWATLLTIDYRIALCVYVMMWGDNIYKANQ